MDVTGRVQETSRLLLFLGVVCCLLLPSSSTTTAPLSFDRSHSIHTVAKKRSNMDLAFSQMCQLCDRDNNGQFSPFELQCLGHILRLLIGGRVK